MGLFEKLGLVEREVVEIPDMEAPVLSSEVEVDVDADIDSAVNIVDEIYEQNELSDKSNSIYTVQALIATLPTEMTTVKKQNTVAGILAVSGKSVASLKDDAMNRRDILNAAQDKVIGERTDEINAAKYDIETLKAAIEAAEIKIKNAEDIIAATKKSVEDEIAVIDELVEFCNGMEAKQ